MQIILCHEWIRKYQSENVRSIYDIAMVTLKKIKNKKGIMVSWIVLQWRWNFTFHAFICTNVHSGNTIKSNLKIKFNNVSNIKPVQPNIITGFTLLRKFLIITFLPKHIYKTKSWIINKSNKFSNIQLASSSLLFKYRCNNIPGKSNVLGN